MEHQMEKHMEHEMATRGLQEDPGLIYGLVGNGGMNFCSNPCSYEVASMLFSFSLCHSFIPE